MSRLEKGGKGGKNASRVGKDQKVLVESTRLFGTQEYCSLIVSNINKEKNLGCGQ